ncbi:glucan synthase [Histoplasma capsulatum H143]|nr:glucan synthase [Histoplasma capsulatum H143]
MSAPQQGGPPHGYGDGYGQYPQGDSHYQDGYYDQNDYSQHDGYYDNNQG